VEHGANSVLCISGVEQVSVIVRSVAGTDPTEFMYTKIVGRRTEAVVTPQALARGERERERSERLCVTHQAIGRDLDCGASGVCGLQRVP
jgi:hypothetical protein